jgi:hypothetical protein
MERREFLGGAAAGVVAGATTVIGKSQAQTNPDSTTQNADNHLMSRNSG